MTEKRHKYYRVEAEVRLASDGAALVSKTYYIEANYAQTAEAEAKELIIGEAMEKVEAGAKVIASQIYMLRAKEA